MREDQIREIEDDVIDLGAATEVTLGIEDLVQKETNGTPRARDF